MKEIEKYTIKLIPYLLVGSLIMLFYGFYSVFYTVPDDYLHKDLIKLMYVHVPHAWISIILYCLVGGCSFLYLVYKSPIYYYLAGCFVLCGISSTIITLVTGALWGKPAWGAYWVWDARLTSVLVLLFIYIIYFLLRRSFQNEDRCAVTSSGFAIIGLINIPIIKFSVYLWNSLHQGSSFITTSGSKVHETMLYPMIHMFLGFLLLNLALSFVEFKTLLLRKKCATID